VRQLRDNHAPFVQGMHCLVPWMNLFIQILSKLPVVSRIKLLLTAMHSYFVHLLKRHIEFKNLAALMNKNGTKILWNVKTRWISMLKLTKRVMQQYPVMLMKMHLQG
jgi:hypothetical protein